MKKVLLILVTVAIVAAMLAVPTFAATIEDVDDYGAFGTEFPGVAFDGADYDGVVFTKDGQPINWDLLFKPEGNYVSGYDWSRDYTPIDSTAADCPSVITIRGWVGADQAFVRFGYKMGDKDPVFNDSFIIPDADTEQGVKDAGGEFARRFKVDVPVKDADVTGTVDVVLLAEFADGTIVAFNSATPALNISFQLTGKAAEGGTPSGGDTPGTDVPPTGDVSVAIFVVAACAIALVVLKKTVF